MKTVLTPKRLFREALIPLLVSVGALSLAARAATINVNSNATLASALSNANPGDTILLANGSYAGFTMTRSGASGAPITIEAANQGSATISSGIINLNGVSYVILQGLTLTTSGGSVAVDGTNRNVGVALINAANCEVTRCTFRLNSPSGDTFWVMLGGHSDSNRVDYNEFGPQNVTSKQNYVAPMGSATIAGVTPPSDRTSWANGNGPVNPNMARNTHIDHNYFHDKPATSNGGEGLALGAIGVTGDYQNVNGLVEYNLFVNCDADPEIITIKSSSNVVRYNTFRACAGMISFRAGNNSSVYGNIMLQAGKSGSGGIKIYEKNHTIFNNYIDHADQYPILIGAGDPYNSGSFSHAQVFNAMIAHNTVVNLANRPVIMGHGGTLAPSGVVFANNIIQGTATLFDERVKPINGSVYSSNLAWSSSSGLPSSGFQVVNPQFTTVNSLQKLSSGSPAINAANPSYFSFVTDDMDGQTRDSQRDIGADEFSSAPITRVPLTTADVGPNAASTTPTPAADPTFSPGTGTYTGVQNVTIASATSGASIRYTTDGSSPSETAGTVYSGPVNVSVTTTLKAIAYKSGFTDSNVTSATYTITMPKAAAPTFSPASGTYNNDQTVTIASATSGASINYTTDGSMPTETNGILYSGPVTVNATATLQAIAFANGFADSTVSLAPYTLVVAPVTFSPASGTFTSAQSVTLSTVTIGATIRYTTDGSTPSETVGTLYVGPITVAATETIKVIAYKSGYSGDAVSSATYTINTGGGNPVPVTLEAESLSPVGTGATVSTSSDANASGGIVEFLNSTAAGQTMTLTTPSIVGSTYQVQMRYKPNTSRGQLTVKVDGVQVGGTVDEYNTSQTYLTTTLGNATIADGPHTIVLTVTGKNAASSAFLVTADTFTFTPVQPQVAAPTFSPPGGTLPLSVTISTATAGASIRYTTDGSTPSETAGTIYSGPVNISSTTTLKAIAYEAGFTDSPVTTATYTATPPPTLNFEAESLSPVGTGATASTSSDTNASGGVVEFLNSTAAGQLLTLTTPSFATAGTYQVQLRYKPNTSRGQLTVKIDGTQVGGTVDEYNTSQTYLTVTLGNTALATGPHTIVLTVTGKNASSSAFLITADKLTFVGQ